MTERASRSVRLTKYAKVWYIGGKKKPPNVAALRGFNGGSRFSQNLFPGVVKT